MVAAVKNCWASLWTAQAISYRHQNGIAQDSMTVVAQIMVPSEVSGILFTANPTTGERGEMIVNASFGLGEAVVNGQVTPDTYIIDRGSRTAKETIIGPKAQKIVADGAQGIRLEEVSEDERAQSSLSEAMLSELGSQRRWQWSSCTRACRRISNGRSPAASCTCCNPDRLPISRCSRSSSTGPRDHRPA